MPGAHTLGALMPGAHTPGALMPGAHTPGALMPGAHPDHNLYTALSRLMRNVNRLTATVVSKI
jgi:hypothetical protein